jgi:hypothetical protein
MYTPDASLASLRVRVDSILNQLRDNPMPVIISGNGAAQEGEGENYGLLTRSLARQALFLGLYKPRRGLIPWFRALRAVEYGDGREMYDLSQRREFLFRCDCSSSSSREEGLINEMELEIAIACSDAVPLTWGKEELKKIHEEIAKTSPEGFGEFLFTNVMCRLVSRLPPPPPHTYCLILANAVDGRSGPSNDSLVSFLYHTDLHRRILWDADDRLGWLRCRGREHKSSHTYDREYSWYVFLLP